MPRASDAGAPRVYLGHCEADAGAAERLAEALRKRGIEPWLAGWEIDPGDVVVHKLEEGMAQADVCLVLMSEVAIDERWMNQQYAVMLSRAIDREEVLTIPVRVDEIADDHMPPMLGARRSVEIGDVERIAGAIARHRGQPAAKHPGPVPADPVPEAELRRYLEKIESLHRELPLAGFETRVRVTIELDDLYVPLDAMIDQRASPEQVFHFEDGAAAAKHHGVRGHRHQVKLAEAFDEAHAQGHRGVVLLGDPGSGKTTHLKQVLLKVVRDGPESVGLPADTVPVFLALRNLRDRTAGFATFIEQELSDPMLTMPEGFGARLCERGRLLLLLDGLDEVVSADERAKVARWIDHARRADPRNRFLVSCRFAGYVDAARLLEGFLELHLRPMSDEQVRTFVRNWYRVVERTGSGDEEQVAVRAERGAATLIEALEDRELTSVSRVYQMTHNPLLLTAICLVHRDRGTLPNKRWLLYHEAVQVLLERWRKVTKQLPVTFPAEQARKVLQPVALWMHEQQGRTRAHTTELVEPVDRALRGAGIGEVAAEEFLRVIRDESGLLTGWGVDSFGFMHLGFQEYLAARAIRRRAFDEPELLDAVAGRFGDSWWQEVILLMLAQDEPPLFDRLMAAVMRRAEAVEWVGSEMMQRCLGEAENPSVAAFVALVRGDGRSWLGRAWQRLSGGGRAELRARQVAALDVVGRAMPEALTELGAELERHPAAEVRAWWQRWQRWGRVGAKRKIDSMSGVELVWIPGGRFLMGSAKDDDQAWDDEKPQHEVELNGFWLGKTPVTNAQYGEYMKAKGGVREPEYWGNSSYNQPEQPVVGVSWEEAVGYCEWAGLSLPTEAQWEYACRAGTTTRYHSGNSEKDLARVGWYEGNSGGRLHGAGELKPNDFGLYDMHGNAYEWCQDTWVDNYEDAEHQPGDGLRTQPVGDSHRVVRGGIFDFGPRSSRSADRVRLEPVYRYDIVGFRVAQGHSG